MANPGVYPVDFNTDVGRFRLLVNDLYSVPLDPVVAGQQDFTLFSDAEITGYLALEDSVYRAAGLAFMGLAATAAREAESIRDFDLQVDRRDKSKALMEQARWFYTEAERLDGEGEEGFTIVRTGRRYTRAELAEFNYSDYDPTDWIQ